MTTRERNYRRNPHTASFLQTFHAGMTEAQRRAASERDEQDALDFVQGRETAPTRPANLPARPEVGTLVQISGYPVRIGANFVTEKQAKWIIDIATTREIPNGATAESVLVRLEQGFAKFAGSQFITNYKDLPRKATPARYTAMVEAVAPGASEEEFRAAQSAVKTRPEVADGRYAVEHEGTLKFYRLKNGRKAGYVFLSVQASDDWHDIRNPRRIDEILALIVEAGELNAARRYGIELGKCSRCGRTLTDQTSREYGMGPECRSK